MSVRTILEINHDYLQDLLAHPDQVERFIRSLGQTQSEAERNAPNGVRVLLQRFHYTSVTLTVK